jgi:hypothetical protein
MKRLRREDRLPGTAMRTCLAESKVMMHGNDGEMDKRIVQAFSALFLSWVSGCGTKNGVTHQGTGRLAS